LNILPEQEFGSIVWTIAFKLSGGALEKAIVLDWFNCVRLNLTENGRSSARWLSCYAQKSAPW